MVQPRRGEEGGCPPGNLTSNGPPLPVVPLISERDQISDCKNNDMTPSWSPVEPSLPLESAQSLANLSTVRIVLFVMRSKCLDWTVELVSLLKPLNAFGSGYMREPGTTDPSVI